jgi:hypothetical protein
MTFSDEPAATKETVAARQLKRSTALGKRMPRTDRKNAPGALHFHAERIPMVPG